MIDQVVSLLNYSTTVPLGTKPTLPESRPAVLQDGEVMNASFPVAWGEPNGSYDAEGIVTVKGTADVLGQNVEVTATIRVEKQKIELGSSVSSAAYLSQDVPEGQQSDTLDAIKDGKKLETTTVEAQIQLVGQTGQLEIQIQLLKSHSAMLLSSV